MKLKLDENLSRHLKPLLAATGQQQSGNTVASLLPLSDASKNRFEVLPLGSESAARRAENFHANIPSIRIDFGARAPSA